MARIAESITHAISLAAPRGAQRTTAREEAAAVLARNTTGNTLTPAASRGQTPTSIKPAGGVADLSPAQSRQIEEIRHFGRQSLERVVGREIGLELSKLSSGAGVGAGSKEASIYGRDGRLEGAPRAPRGLETTPAPIPTSRAAPATPVPASTLAQVLVRLPQADTLRELEVSGQREIVDAAASATSLQTTREIAFTEEARAAAEQRRASAAEQSQRIGEAQHTEPKSPVADTTELMRQRLTALYLPPAQALASIRLLA